MSARPNRELLQDIAIELGVHPSFVEKDWYAIQAVSAIVAADHGGLRPVFSGGTSLSKGYGIIQRFSEDIDFKLLVPGDGLPRAKRSLFRRQLIETLRSSGSWTIEEDAIEVFDDRRAFRCLLGYDPLFPATAALRTEVQLEMRLEAPALLPEERSLTTFVAEACGAGPEVPAIACVTPAETAADKLSALTWRVLARQRGAQGDDPTVIRHLHDLAALEASAVAHPSFPKLASRLLLQDATRGNARTKHVSLPPDERVAAALKVLNDDPEYRDEYRRFVLDMSYADTSEGLDFDSALAATGRLRTLLR